MVFSANKNFEQFCKTLNSPNTLKTLPPNFFFYDSKYNVKWNLDLSLGYFNFLRNKNNLIPKSKPFDYLSLFKFFFVRENSNVYDVVGESKIYKNFWEPLTLGVMNTSPKKASAKVY